MKFKSRNGLHPAKHVTTCGYLAMVGLKKALKNEFTDDMFKEFIKENNYSPTTRVGDDKRDRINKFLNKLDKLPYGVIEGIYKTYLNDGLMAVVRELNRPITLLKRTNKLEIDD